MASDSERHVQLQIGHVLFMDLVGYSKLLLDEQRELQDNWLGSSETPSRSAP